jgi:hypothetical protein
MPNPLNNSGVRRNLPEERAAHWGGHGKDSEAPQKIGRI